MNNTLYAWVAGGMPTLAVLIGILINRYDIGRLDRRLESIESDRKEFYPEWTKKPKNS